MASGTTIWNSVGGWRGVLLRTWQGGKVVSTAAMREATSDFRSFSDAWLELLVDQLGPDGETIDYDRLIESSQQLVTAEPTRLDGSPCVKVVVELRTSRGEAIVRTLWHDQSKNYLVRRIENHTAAGRLLNWQSVTEFTEAQPGVFVPIRCERSYFTDGGDLRHSRVAVLSEVLVNQPLPPGAMDMPKLLPGSELRDAIKGVRGPVDPNWNPMAAMTPFQSKVYAVAPGRESEPAAGSGSPTQSEPHSLSYWVTLTCLASANFRLLLLLLRSRLQRSYANRG